MAATPPHHHHPPLALRPARSRRPVPARFAARRRAPLPVAAAVAAIWAAVISYAPVMAATGIGAIGSSSTPGDVGRFALAAWLLGHGVPIITPTDRISLAPLAITALAAWRVARAGVHASRAAGGQRSRSLRPAGSAALAVAVAYAALGAAAAAAGSTAERSLTPTRAAVTLGCFALAAAGVGALSHSRAARTRWARAPAVATEGLRTGLVAAVLVLAAGAVAAGGAMAVRGGPGVHLLDSYRAGVLGQAGITALELVYAPNIAVWATAYLLGPGFAVGVGTVVSPSVVILGPVPAIPVLAGLPTAPAAGPWAGVEVVPVLAGAAAGVSLGRRLRRAQLLPRVSPAGVLGAAALAGPVVGALVQLAAFASAGALGSDQLLTLGPAGGRVGLVATVMVGMGVLAGAGTALAVTPGQPRRTVRPSRVRSPSGRRTPN